MLKLFRSAIAVTLMLALVSCKGAPEPDSAPQADSTPVKLERTQAIIDINTSKLTPILPEMVGEHNAITNQNYVMNSKDFLKVAEEHGRMGFIRWTGGTSNNGVNWRLGAIDAEYSAQSYLHRDRYYRQVDDRINVEAKGFDRISALREFLQKTGSKAMIVANVFQQTPEEIGDLAKYLHDNNIPVIYFELGNEVEFFTGESDSYLIYKSGADYLDRGKAFNDAIKKNYPGAKVVIAMSNKATGPAFDNSVYAYKGEKYWDAMTVHRFQGGGNNIADALKSGNSALEEWDEMLDQYPKKFNDPKLDIYIGEQSPALGGILAGTQYQGVYQAESVMRLLSHPNIRYTVGWYIDKDSSDNSHLLDYSDAWQRGETVDAVNLDHKMYARIPILGSKIVTNAVNESEAYWETSVTGGVQVEGLKNKKLPALYAKAFKGANGVNYTVITNKSAEAHHVTIRMDGKAVSGELTRTYISNTNPGVKNTANRTNVKIMSDTSGNPIVIPPYSATRIEWKSERKPEKPNPPSLIYADAGNGKANLKWSPALRTTGYKVKYGTAPGKYTQNVDVGNVTEYSVSGLQSGQTYYFAVTASNVSGESAASNEAEVKLAAPAAPLIRYAHPERSSRAIVEWQNVQNAAGYKLMYGTKSGSYDKTIDIGNNAGHIVTGLTNGTTYYFAVQAYNGVGEGPLSEEAAIVPQDSLPFAPHHLLMKKEAETSAALEWKPSLADTVFEYFNDGDAANWSQEKGVWKAVPHPDKDRSAGVYQLAEGQEGISLYKGSLTDDYEVEALVDANRLGPQDKLGIVARYKDANNHYKFTYDKIAGLFTLIKVEGGKETELGKKKINLDASFFRMYLRVEGDTIIGVANREEVAKVKDTTFASGKAGVYAKGTKGFFDLVRIYESNADTYDVYRSTDPHTGYEKIASGLTETTYTDNTAAAGVTYFYYVKARNEDGESYRHSNIARKN